MSDTVISLVDSSIYMLHAAIHHPYRLALYIIVIYFTRRILNRLLVPPPISVAPRIPTYLPFGIDFIVWSSYYNSTNQDLKLWSMIFRRYGRGTAPYTAEVVLGGDRVIFTADHENIKAVLATKFSDYGKGPKFYHDWKEFLGDSIFATDGRLWQDARGLIKPLFLRQRIEDLAVFEKHTVKLTRMLQGPEGQPIGVDVKDLFFRFTLDVATDFLFGQAINSLDNPREQFMEVFISETLSLERDELEKLTKSDRGYTFLSALALYTRDAKQIRDQLVAVLLAGRDTTAATLSWVLHELSGHPDMVRRLRQEIAQHVKPGQNPSFAELKAMKYLQAILNETLRMYPAIPFNMRIALDDTSLPRGGGSDGNQFISVKKDTIIAYTPLVMMRRNDLYPATYNNGDKFPDPNTFDPERWLHPSVLHTSEKGADASETKASGVNNKEWSPRPWTYIPFNGGPRICLGQQFALTEMGYTLVRIFQQFARVERRMEPDEMGILSANIVLTPKNGVRVAFFKEEED
ncbi:hypothetical protein J7337_002233 [Fusarium musae]|uniref:Cytochrome P450 n=1 Tax=Fusarium musae TaxID=1042133 RepID=A0A9P8IRZ5_9HYPO|nr:hypothetical protein J7337_002233 [Fusarium musae]KAG9505266.1 hypothetical protein J7337_002233 [Fusarium musae]